jgi:hypothetical protein
VLLDRTHRSWAFLSAVIFAVATASYVIYAEMSPRGPTGGSLMGLVYGVVGSAFMIFAGLLAGRKQVPFWRLGSAQFWLRGHLWLGTLSVPLILFHSGFGLGGIVEQLLWAFFALVVLSGFFGLAMQHLLPRLMTSQVPRETFRAQIPYLRKRNRLLSDRLVATACGRLPVTSDSLRPQLERLTRFAAELRQQEEAAPGRAEKEAVRERRATWLSQLDREDAGLFRDVARFAKNSGWCRTENDFSTLLLDIYDFPGVTPAAEPPPSTDPSAEESPKPAGKPAAKPAAGGMSPLEIMKAKQAAARSGAAPEAGAVGQKKASPLDMIRGQGGAAKSKSALAAGALADKPVVTKAAEGSSSRKPEPVPKIVQDVDAEVAAVEKVLTEKYGYSSELAGDAAERTRRFLQTEEQAAAVQAAREAGVDENAVPARSAAAPAAGKGSSPLDLIRKGGASAKKDKPADKPADKPTAKSPLELMKAKAGGGSQASAPPKSAAPKPPAPRKAAAKREVLRIGELRDFYLQTVRPYLAGNAREGRLSDPTETSRAFTQMRATLPVELHEILETLQQYCEEHRQFSEQVRIHRWLHYWLALHIPFSIGLFVLFVFHVLMSLRAIQVGNFRNA